MKRARLGDVLEMRTPAGLAYLQYTHQHPIYGGLVRVLPGTYDERPDTIPELVTREARFVVFFPVRAAVSRGLVTVVANQPVPAHAASFPLFKAGRPGNWWLWDGEREWRVGELTPAQRLLPYRETWNDTLLASRIAANWTPEEDALELM